MQLQKRREGRPLLDTRALLEAELVPPLGAKIDAIWDRGHSKFRAGIFPGGLSPFLLGSAVTLPVVWGIGEHGLSASWGVEGIDEDRIITDAMRALLESVINATRDRRRAIALSIPAVILFVISLCISGFLWKRQLRAMLKEIRNVNLGPPEPEPANAGRSVVSSENARARSLPYYEALESYVENQRILAWFLGTDGEAFVWSLVQRLVDADVFPLEAWPVLLKKSPLAGRPLATRSALLQEGASPALMNEELEGASSWERLAPAGAARQSMPEAGGVRVAAELVATWGRPGFRHQVGEVASGSRPGVGHTFLKRLQQEGRFAHASDAVAQHAARGSRAAAGSEADDTEVAAEESQQRWVELAAKRRHAYKVRQFEDSEIICWPVNMRAKSWQERERGAVEQQGVEFLEEQNAGIIQHLQNATYQICMQVSQLSMPTERSVAGDPRRGPNKEAILQAIHQGVLNFIRHIGCLDVYDIEYIPETGFLPVVGQFYVKLHHDTVEYAVVDAENRFRQSDISDAALRHQLGRRYEAFLDACRSRKNAGLRPFLNDLLAIVSEETGGLVRRVSNEHAMMPVLAPAALDEGEDVAVALAEQRQAGSPPALYVLSSVVSPLHDCLDAFLRALNALFERREALVEEEGDAECWEALARCFQLVSEWYSFLFDGPVHVHSDPAWLAVPRPLAAAAAVPSPAMVVTPPDALVPRAAMHLHPAIVLTLALRRHAVRERKTVAFYAGLVTAWIQDPLRTGPSRMSIYSSWTILDCLFHLSPREDAENTTSFADIYEALTPTVRSGLLEILFHSDMELSALDYRRLIESYGISSGLCWWDALLTRASTSTIDRLAPGALLATLLNINADEACEGGTREILEKIRTKLVDHAQQLTPERLQDILMGILFCKQQVEAHQGAPEWASLVRVYLGSTRSGGGGRQIVTRAVQFLVSAIFGAPSLSEAQKGERLAALFGRPAPWNIPLNVLDELLVGAHMVDLGLRAPGIRTKIWALVIQHLLTHSDPGFRTQGALLLLDAFWTEASPPALELLRVNELIHARFQQWMELLKPLAKRDSIEAVCKALNHAYELKCIQQQAQEEPESGLDFTQAYRRAVCAYIYAFLTKRHHTAVVENEREWRQGVLSILEQLFEKQEVLLRQPFPTPRMDDDEEVQVLEDEDGIVMQFASFVDRFFTKQGLFFEFDDVCDPSHHVDEVSFPQAEVRTYRLLTEAISDTAAGPWMVRMKTSVLSALLAEKTKNFSWELQNRSLEQAPRVVAVPYRKVAASLLFSLLNSVEVPGFFPYFSRHFVQFLAPLLSWDDVHFFENDLQQRGITPDLQTVLWSRFLFLYLNEALKLRPPRLVFGEDPALEVLFDNAVAFSEKQAIAKCFNGSSFEPNVVKTNFKKAALDLCLHGVRGEGESVVRLQFNVFWLQLRLCLITALAIDTVPISEKKAWVPLLYALLTSNDAGEGLERISQHEAYKTLYLFALQLEWRAGERAIVSAPAPALLNRVVGGRMHDAVPEDHEDHEDHEEHEGSANQANPLSYAELLQEISSSWGEDLRLGKPNKGWFIDSVVVALLAGLRPPSQGFRGFFLARREADERFRVAALLQCLMNAERGFVLHPSGSEGDGDRAPADEVPAVLIQNLRSQVAGGDFDFLALGANQTQEVVLRILDEYFPRPPEGAPSFRRS